MKANGQDALELGELGLAVFPLYTWNVDHCDCPDKTCGTLNEHGELLGSPAKHPRTIHGHNDASTEQAQIIRWWGMWPSANIGVATEPSGLVVLDIDPRNGGMEAWIELEESHGYEHLGPACITGSGGMHLWFKAPDTKVLSRSGKIGPGLDVKAAGGYVVVPPSVHYTGGVYAWVEGYAPWDKEPQAIPEWLLELMQKPLATDKHGVQPIAARLAKGGRNEALASLAGSMRHRGMGETAIFNALMAENAEKCEPPLDTREVAKIAASYMRYPPGEPSAPIIIDTPRRAKSGPERREEAYLPSPGTFEELRHKELPPTQWAVPKLLPQGCGMLAGAAKLGKSWLVLNLCFHIAEGTIAFGKLPTIPGDCLYLALEDGENRLKERTTLLMGADEEWPARAWYETKWPRIDEGGKEALEAWLGQHPEARIVVIDTFVLFKPLDAGKSSKDIYAGDYAAVRAVKAIADEYGVCILLVTHLNKGEHADWVNGMTGSTGLSGSADTLLNLARPDGGRDVAAKDEAVLKLTGRDVEEQAWACKRDGNGWWKIEGDATEVGEERKSNETVHFMKMLWLDGFREVDASTLRTLTGSTKATANRLLARAANAGLINRIRQGVYGLSPTDVPVRSDSPTRLSDMEFNS